MKFRGVILLALISSLSLSADPLMDAAFRKAGEEIAQKALKAKLGETPGLIFYKVALVASNYFVPPTPYTLGLNLIHSIGSEIFKNWEKPGPGEVLMGREEKFVKTAVKIAGLTGAYAISGPLAHLFTGLYFSDMVLPGSTFSFPLKYMLGTEALPLKSTYPLSEFSTAFGKKAGEPIKREETYLSCSYIDQNSSSASFNTWASENLISDEVKKELNIKFLKNTVLIHGRWIKDPEKGYLFGTTMNPLSLNAICINALTNYAAANLKSIKDLNWIMISASNSSATGYYPIVFYRPVLKKGPNYGPYKKDIIGEAILVTSETKPLKLTPF